jgi:nucleoside-diphosphate-sugar epimerase
MRVLITGGAGHVGKATTKRLVRRGWDVRVIGLESGVEIPGAEFVTCDIMSYDDLRKQMRGCQAVVHLAGIRGPQLAPGHTIFEINVAGTFNVFESAAAEGIRRVVQASSINALGCAYSTTDIAPEYFPVDEEHPSFTNDPYSYSKQIVEDIGRYYWRREGISSVAMRFPWVYSEGYVESEIYLSRRRTGRQALDELAALPDAERQKLLADARHRALEYRKQRPLEFNGGMVETPKRESAADQLWYAYAFDRFNFWAFVDERDAAQAMEKALVADYTGAHTLFINDHHNWLGYDSKSLVRCFFPEVGDSKITLSGSQALVGIDRARGLIDFEPEHSVENRDNL